MTEHIRPEFTPGTLPTYLGYHLQIFGAGRAKISLQTETKKKNETKRVTCVVDGDTFWLGVERIRIQGYDTPETTTNLCGRNRSVQLGLKVTARLHAAIEQRRCLAPAEYQRLAWASTC